MPQELQVLRCCACESFQGHIVKKDKKWVCKICNQKQATQMVYGRGSGKDCRVIVQELNMRRLHLDESTPTCKFELTEYPNNAEKYIKTEENPQTSRWREFVQFDNRNNDAVDAKNCFSNFSEIRQNISEDLVVADLGTSKLENKSNHLEHYYEDSPLRCDKSAENNDDREPPKEDCQDYVCVSFKSNETVIIKHQTDCQTSTNKRIISKSDNENAKRIKLDYLECSASSYKDSIDYSNKSATFDDKENKGMDALKNKHNIHSKILEENEKDGNKFETNNIKKNIQEASIFESEHFDVDDLYSF